jgi:hypothetical protein
VREVIIRRFCAACYRHGRRTELAAGHSEYSIVVNEFGAKTDLCDHCAQSVLVPLLEMMSAGEDLAALSRQDWAQLGSVFPRAAAIRKLNGPPSIKPATSAPAGTPATSAPARVPGAGVSAGVSGAGVPAGVSGAGVPAAGDTGNAADPGGGVKPVKAKPRTKTPPGRSTTAAGKPKAAAGRATAAAAGRAAAGRAAAGKSHICQGCGQTFTRAANLAIHVDHFGTGPHSRPARRGAALIADTTQQPPAQQDDPAQQDPVQQDDPAQQDPAQQDPVQQDPAPQDPVQQDPAQEDPAPQDPVQQDPAPQDPAQDDPAQQDATRETASAAAQQAPTPPVSDAKLIWQPGAKASDSVGVGDG